MTSSKQADEYDFKQCKLCAAYAASPRYLLKKTTIYACSECGFHFIDHLDRVSPDLQADAAKPLDQASWNYIEGRLPASEKQLRKNLSLVKRHVSLTGTSCLDIGAGSGLFSHLLAEEGALAYGIEPQSIFREFSKRKFDTALFAETIDSEYWQKGHANYFDVVTLWDVIEHVNFPVEILQHAYNVMKPGGWLFLDTPRRDALFYRISEWSYRSSNGSNPLFLESIYSPRPFRHKHIFTLRQLLRLMDKLGFSVVDKRTSLLQNKMVLACRKP
jgi:2-polyprenyl-6-hydroxyphenyl methylase/3-demethylubiquinone-9 3-methyltransferase